MLPSSPLPATSALESPAFATHIFGPLTRATTAVQPPNAALMPDLGREELMFSKISSKALREILVQRMHEKIGRLVGRNEMGGWEVGGGGRVPWVMVGLMLEQGKEELKSTKYIYINILYISVKVPLDVDYR